jgi:hypothetical protein
MRLAPLDDCDQNTLIRAITEMSGFDLAVTQINKADMACHALAMPTTVRDERAVAPAAGSLNRVTTPTFQGPA